MIRDGEVVLDRAFGCADDSLFWIFSASKPFPALLVHVLAERGLIDLDTPVARYWPEFGRHGKDAITVRHVLQHRSGVPTAGSTAGDILAMTDWQRSVRRIEDARPRWPAGTVPAYQFLGYGFTLGELVRRVTGSPVDVLLRDTVLEPLGLRDTYLGLPDEHWHRHVPVRAPGPMGLVLNRRSTRRAVIPAAGVSTTARDLATFYQALLDDPRILRPDTLARALAPSTDGERDRFARAQIRWSEGFQLGGPRPDPATFSPMGRHSSPRAFGHNGSNCCMGWADPDRRLVVAYLTNRLTHPRADKRHHADVADTLLSACEARAA